MFVEESSTEEWAKRGDDFFRQKLFEVAAKCYGHAGQSLKEKQAIAFHYAQQASRLRSKPDKMRPVFLRAATAFVEAEAWTEAARCLVNAREHKLAAQFFEKQGQVCSSVLILLFQIFSFCCMRCIWVVPRYEGLYNMRLQIYHAATLYMKVNLIDNACAAYESAYYYGDAVSLLVKFGRYDEAIDVVTRYRQLVDVSSIGLL
jgi:tetratricopeptide (TPR) repeat protein